MIRQSFHRVFSQSIRRTLKVRRRRAISLAPERLERRALLAVTTFSAEGDLRVTLDAAEDAVFGVDGSNNVTMNGTQILNGGLPIPASTVRWINVTGGSGPNLVDTKQVKKAEFPNIVHVTVNGGNGDDTLLAQDDATVNFLSRSTDHVHLLNGGPGDDLLVGGGLNDSLFGHNGNDTLIAGFGNDFLAGGSGDDDMHGRSGNDRLLGQAGRDDMHGETGADTVDGGLGDDIAGSGKNTLPIWVDPAIADGVANGTYILTWADIMAGRVRNIDVATGGRGDGNDLVVTFTGQGIAFGGAGNDTVTGNEGNDTLYGGLGDDVLLGGSNNDVLLGGRGNDSIFADINRTNGDTEFVPNPDEDNNDTIFGELGDDSIDGGLGSDQIDGGEGTDQLMYEFGSTSTTLTGSTFSGSGGPAGTISAAFQSVEGFGLRGTEGDDTFNLSDAPGPVSVDGRAGNDTVQGSAFDDVLLGSGGNDELHGAGGHDRLIGGAGDDVLMGGAGDDIILPNAHNDTIDGGPGTDGVFASGSNLTLSDTALQGAGNDTLADIEQVTLHGSSNADILDASGATIPVTIRGRGGADLIIGGSGNDRLEGHRDADTISGGPGNDAIFGHADNDSLSGGPGDDVLLGLNGDDILNGDEGADSLTGGAGADIPNAGTDDDIDVVFSDAMDTVSSDVEDTVNVV